MGKREHYGPERSPFRIIIYIMVVVALLGGIGYLVKYSRDQQSAYQEEIQQMGADETEYVPPVREKKETEMTETEAASTSESESETEEISETETEDATEAALKKKHILLLNGSGKDGMAAVWQKKLEQAGYEKVSVASFPGASVERTRIFAAKEDEVPILQKLFTDAEERTEEFTAEITMEDGSAVPKDVEVYIVIGKQDAA